MRAFRRLFQGLGWALVATWLYVHAFLLAVNHFRPGVDPYVRGPLWSIFKVALSIAFTATLPWLFGAVGLLIFLSWRRLRPTFADLAVLLLILGCVGTYVYLGFQD